MVSNDGVGRSGCRRVLHLGLRYKPLAAGRTDRPSCFARIPSSPVCAAASSFGQSASDAAAAARAGKLIFLHRPVGLFFTSTTGARAALVGRKASIDRSPVMLRPCARMYTAAAAAAAAAADDGKRLGRDCLNLYFTRIY